MIILLPAAGAGPGDALWLRARAPRAGRAGEEPVESTSMVMGTRAASSISWMTVGITDEDPMHPMPDLEPDGSGKQGAGASADVIFSDDETALSAFDVGARGGDGETGDPDLVPELDLAHEGFDLPVVRRNLDLSGESGYRPRARDEGSWTEEELQGRPGLPSWMRISRADLAKAQAESRSRRDEPFWTTLT